MTSDRPGAPIIIRDASQLASVLYRRRLERGQTLANLAARIGCTVQRVSLWLRGNQVPQADGLVKLADALGYDLALIPRDSEAVRPDLEPPPSAETIAGVLAIVDAPYQSGLDVRIEEDA